MYNVCFYKAPQGLVVRIGDNGTNIKEIGFVQNACGCCLNALESDLGRIAKIQLNEYFTGGRTSFDLPIDPEGTEFQQKVWKALQNIPYGQLRSYKEVAQAVGCPGGYRAVGGANNKNPIAVVIPCHRVVASDMSIGGYSDGTEIKRMLLGIEGSERFLSE